MKVALVTGGSKRIGRAILLRLATEGYTCLVHYHQSAAEAEQTRQDCLSAGAPQAHTLACDLSDETARRSLIARTLDQTGRIDLLVNSASLFEYDTAKTFTTDLFTSHLQTNYLAPVELTMGLHAALSDGTGPQAHVVTLLDQKLFNLNTDYMSYTLAKLASHSSIRYLAQCCAPRLRVNAIAPGVTLPSPEMDAAAFSRAHGIAATGASSTAQDIAQAVWLLESSPAITGQTLTVDGGQHLVPRARDVAFGDTAC